MILNKRNCSWKAY